MQEFSGDLFDYSFPPTPTEPELEARRLADRERVLLLVPVLATISQVSSTLGSRKIEGLLRDLLNDESFAVQPGPCLMATALAVELRCQNWARYLRPLAEKHEARRAVAEIVETLAWPAYFDVDLKLDDQRDLENALADIRLHRYPSGARRPDARGVELQDVRKKRTRWLARIRGEAKAQETADAKN